MSNSLNFLPNSPTYSTLDRIFYPSVPANSQTSSYTPVQGIFRVSRLEQSDILKVLDADPVDKGHLQGPYDVSLKATLSSIWKAVGKIAFKNNHLAGCTLLSHDLAIVPCHSIEDLDVRTLHVTFGRVLTDQHTLIGDSYNVQGIVECDPALDYAILKLEGTPGKKYGFLPIRQEGVNSHPALLHYPLGKPQKISIHAYNQQFYQSNWLDTYHDTDYGSSGGAYISPAGSLVAIHLGSQRNSFSFNLLRLALPIQRIIEEQSTGILNRFIHRNLDQNSVCNAQIQWYYISPQFRDFIDFELFDHTKINQNFYLIRSPSPSLPGIRIDPGQAKHTLDWPGGWQGGRESVLKLNLDDTISLAEIIGKDCPTFNTLNPQNHKPPKIPWDVNEKLLPHELKKKLKKLQISSIEMHAAFVSQTNMWEMHFFPSRK